MNSEETEISVCKYPKETMASEYIDVAIIGAGVAGLYSAYCCGISGLDCLIIDSLMMPGGQCSTLYSDKKVYGVPGFKDITAKDFIDNLSKQCLGFAKKSFLGYRVESITRTPDGLFTIKSANHCTCDVREIKAKYLILATGMGDMKPSVPSTIAGIREIEKSSDFIQYYCMKMDIYKGKSVIIAGGGDAAIDFTIGITPLANSVTLIHRRSQFACEESKLKAIKELEKSGKLKILLEHNISGLKEKYKIRTVIAKTQDSKEVILNIDHIIFCYGFIPSCGNMFGLKELGLEMQNNLINVDINTMETSIENCYAAGDVVAYPNKKKNIVPCFFEADRIIRMIKAKQSQDLVENAATYKS
jgi:thioredoxin reductase (NADPH)